MKMSIEHRTFELNRTVYLKKAYVMTYVELGRLMDTTNTPERVISMRKFIWEVNNMGGNLN